MPLPRELSLSWSLAFFSITKRRDKNELINLLKDAGVWGTSIARIFGIVCDLGDERGRLCKSVVLETQYVDRDYADAYSRLYGRSFHPYGRLCYRLHFFSREFNSPEDIHIESYSKEKIRLDKLQQDYQGYCIVRPSHPDTVGRTVIAPPKSIDRNQYILCRQEYSLNLAGLKLEAEGSPFLEQDGMVGACATAAIWMAHMSLYKLRGLPTYSTTEITEIADATYPSPERVFPSKGLTVEQVGVALKRMGHETIIVNLEGTHPIAVRRWLYHYIESGLPIVLGIKTKTGRHAVTTVGHTVKSSPLSNVLMEELTIGSGLQGLRYCSAADWVESILLHDDQIGPYREAFIPCSGTSRASIQVEGVPRRGRVAKSDLLAAIVPLPRHVYLLAEEAEGKATIIITLMKNLGLLDSNFDQEGLVFRTFLVESNHFKLSLDTAERETEPLLGWLYQKRHLPRYIWLIEVSKLPLWNVNLADKRIVGEIIVDPTSNPVQLDALALDIEGRFWASEPGDQDIFVMFKRDPISIPNWKPATCLARPCS